MVRAGRTQTIRMILASSLLCFLGGGCVVIYGFDDFAKDSPKTCMDSSECKDGSDLCGTHQCEEGICVLRNIVATGSLTIRNETGNCLRFVCDGLGNEIIEIDSTNVRPDGDPCTEDLCVEGKPVNIVAPSGTQCGTNANVQCTDNGVCVGCLVNTDCGEDTACVTWTCVDMTCVRNLQPIGTEVSNPVVGDCKKNLCNEVGDFPETFAATDAPDDENPCTADYCTPNGEIVHGTLPEGTSCGECLTCAKDTTCNPCDAATLDCYEGACIPKPQECMVDTDCPSTYCVDGYCCDSQCSSKCMACDEKRTGVHSGICAPIKNGDDPQTECNSPAGDACFNGNCRCENGVQDDGEGGTDCGGSCNPCTGTWNCGGTDACNGAVVPVCCWDDLLLCAACPDDRKLCNDLHGKTCVKGTPPQAITLGQVTYNKCFWPSNACQQVVCRCQ
jgi:hypothetical protein